MIKFIRWFFSKMCRNKVILPLTEGRSVGKIKGAISDIRPIKPPMPRKP